MPMQWLEAVWEPLAPDPVLLEGRHFSRLWLHAGHLQRLELHARLHEGGHNIVDCAELR